MGYACPVCGAPQVDAEHLAHHLAMTATVHGEAHASWLDTHAPGWQDGGAADLAPRVVEYADTVDVPTVVERDLEEADPPPRSPRLDRTPDETVQRALDRARELLEDDRED